MKLFYCKSHRGLLQEQLGSVLRNVLFICFFFSFYTSVSGQSDQFSNNNEITSNESASDKCPSTLTAAELQAIVARDAQRVKDGKSAPKSMVREVPIKIHIVRNDTGGGGLNPTSAFADIAQANSLFSIAGFNFYQCGPINYIDNNTYFDEIEYSTSSSSNEYIMANANKVSDALNVFYCPKATYFGSTTSWSSFPSHANSIGKDWIIMGNYHSDNESTFSHEAGHWFDLYHTHQGNENVTRIAGDPCYNCITNGDLLCDTPADKGWGFTSSCGYNATFQDSCDLFFVPLTDNIMSYASKPCRDFFTTGQINRMKDAYDLDRTNIHNPTSCPTECTTDAAEPNNTAAAAEYLGTLSSYTVNDLCITSLDRDYFRVYVWGHSYYIKARGYINATGEYKLTYSRSGATMTFETASNNGSTTDTYLTLYTGTNGTTILANDNNSGSGNFSKITYTIPPCNKPTAAQNTTSNITTTSARLNCSATGLYRDFRYKVSTATSWTNVWHTSASFKNISGLTAGTTYQWQSRVYCGPWSSWSTTETFTTTSACTPEVATASEIDNSQSVYCDYAYGYCQGHPGDYKQFQLKNLSVNSFYHFYTTGHYVPFQNLTPSTNYRYRVRMKCGTTGSYGGWSVYEYFTTPACLAGETGNSLSGQIQNSKVESSSVANSMELRNYPNPFNGQTTIEFDLDNDAAVTLYVSDLSGKKIQVLLNNEQRANGIHQVMFDGSKHPAGIYYYTMQAGEHLITKKMILVK